MLRIAILILSLFYFVSELHAQHLSGVRPNQNQVVYSAGVQFAWNTHPDAVSYTFTLSRQADLSNPEVVITQATNTLNHTLLHFGQYHWRITGTTATGTNYFSAVHSFTHFTPSLLPGLSLWLDAADAVTDGAQRVSVWSDKSGQGNHVSQATLSNMPVRQPNTLNGNPAITFNGTTQFLDGGNILNFGTSSQTIFVVARAQKNNSTLFSKSLWGNAPSRYALIWEGPNLLYLYHDNGLRNISTPHAMGNFGVITISTSRATGLNRLFANGLPIGQSAINPAHNFTSDFNFLIGAYNNTAGGVPPIANFNHQGEIAEILMYFQDFSPGQSIKVENYLRHKYFPSQFIEPVNLGFDIVSSNLCPITLDAGSRFVSYIWSTGATTRTIAVNRPGTYSVTATDMFGMQSTDQIVVTSPITALNANPQQICAGETITIYSLTPSPELYTFLWSTGQTTHAIDVRTTGSYWVRITDANGCSAWSDTLHLSVDNLSNIATLGPDRPFCMGAALSLEGSGAAVEFLWSTGATVPSITVNEPGTYWVRAVSAAGCVAVDTVSLSFGGHRPTALFSSTGACPGQPISFTDLSTVAFGAVVSWHWDFQDGNTSTQRHPVHTPARPPGIAPVTLHVMTDAGCSNSTTLPVRVFHNPQVSFTPNHACSRAPLQFTDTSSDPDLGGITAWQWSFPDGSGSSSQNASFTFPQSGSFPVTLHATSAAGCSASLTRTVLVRESPQLDFSWTTACPGEQVHFTEISSAPVWAPITAREWFFGDGNASTRLNPAHTFPSDGVFPVTLSLTAANGCRISLTQEVTVHSLPVVDFAIADLCQGVAHRFVDQSTVARSTITGWNWSFGNQGSSSLQNPSFAFASPGQHAVRLEAVSAAGCRNQTTRNIVVHPAPRAAFSFAPDMGASPLNVIFTNLSTGANQFLWSFGDGSPASALPAPVHTFRTDGRYRILLTATSQHGCTDTLSREIRVVPIVMDAAITQIGYSHHAGFMQITANLLNLGTRDLDTLMLDLHMEGRRPIREVWSGRLRTGDITSYAFKAQFPLRPNEQPAYICISAITPAHLPSDINPANNTRCLSFRESFQLLDPRPNPAASTTTLPIVVPKEGEARIALYDIYGNRLWEQPSYELIKGVNFVTIPMHTLQNGIFIIQVRINEETRMKRVMKMQ